MNLFSPVWDIRTDISEANHSDGKTFGIVDVRHVALDSVS
jgi:hypothetical protein